MATNNTPLPAALKDVPTPAKIVEHLDKFVIGQEEAKRTLAVAVYNHYRRLQLANKNANRKWKYGKSNVILMGPTGSGKTHLVNTIARMLNVPCYIQDCTKITASGYVGSDVEDCLAGLLRSCNYDVSKAEMGIVMLDEVDKIRKAECSISVTRDVSGECVQQSLLKIVEGDVVGVPPMGGRKHPEQSLIYVDTTNILFIASGAFVGLDDLIRKRTGKTKGSIGFCGTSNNEEQDQSSVYDRILPEDLHRFGMIPEFVGRFPIVAHVNQLKKEDLIKIFVEPDDSLLRQYSELLWMDGIHLFITKPALECMAEVALEIGTGARALRSVAEIVLRDVMFDAPSYRKKNPDSEATKYQITEEMVRNRLKVLLDAV